MHDAPKNSFFPDLIHNLTIRLLWRFVIEGSPLVVANFVQWSDGVASRICT
jgi:hypothetical protein